MRSALSLTKQTVQEWLDDDALQWAAALSYYASLAAAPLLVLLLAVTGLAVDAQTVADDLLVRIERWVGPAGAEIARSVFESDRASGVWASIMSLVFVIVGATGVFAQLQKALNDMWEVEVDGSIKRMLRSRLLAFGLVLGIGLLLVASLVVRAWVANVTTGFAAQALNIGITGLAFTVVLAAIYKVLPDVQIEWRDVWIGAFATAVLFVLGQLAIGVYMSRAAPGSAYGAAGSLLAVLVWIYYSALILFLGAEFTQVWAREKGRRIEPEEGARRVGEAGSQPRGRPASRGGGEPEAHGDRGSRGGGDEPRPADRAPAERPDEEPDTDTTGSDGRRISYP